MSRLATPAVSNGKPDRADVCRLKDGHAGTGDREGQLQTAVFAIQSGSDKAGFKHGARRNSRLGYHPDFAVYHLGRVLVTGLGTGLEVFPGNILGEIEHGVENVAPMTGEILAPAQAPDVEHFVYQEIEIPAVDCLRHGF